MISNRLEHHIFLVRLLLFALSTRIGTFVLGGKLSLSPSFPFLLKFSELPLHKRQQLALSLYSSWFLLIRMGFFGFKSLILLSFFSQVDKNGQNPSWKAIGYCGPDPNFKSKRSKDPNQQLNNLKPKPLYNDPIEEAHKQSQDPSKTYHYGPLYNGIINSKHPQEIVIESLRHFGFHVSTNNKNKNPKMSRITIQCEVVVVGSGSGGGLIAGVLASQGYKVLVLEKGDYYARSNLSLLEGQTLDQMYEGAGIVSTRDLGVSILAGSTVGGGSAINWSASIRTPKHVIKEWAQVHGLDLFDSHLYEEALDVVCEKMGVQNDVNEDGFNNAVLRKGCLELGYPVMNIPRNSPADHYCGWCCLGCKDGKKKGTCETWLKDMVDSGNGAILVGCEVTKVRYERKNGRARDRAKGVEFKLGSCKNDVICVVDAKATVIAAGALNTPALLNKSGLKNPNIGRNLHLHPVVMAWGYFPETDSSENVWPEQGKMSYEGGIMTVMSPVVSEFNGSGYGALIQTPSLHPGLFSALMPWTSGLNIKQRMRNFSRTAHMIAIVRDISSGTISNSPFDISYKITGSDENNLKRGLEKMLRILAAAGAEEIGTHHKNGESIRVKEVNNDEFEEFVRRESCRSLQGLEMPITSAHQMGSCRMGIDPKTSVVNQKGESWEVEGLYLGDSSVLPTALGVNPMVTIQAIAYCTSQSVLDFLGRKMKDEL